ncbi:PREDICTED: uncharacterized protein LOC109235000 [Nicotiana attenuata]|uniref:uncharacterized protein LOC109235000 n=1 Tax=Nicotiana attenuata TaxID=49451 RepID=UPI0009051CF9|nr:PREDICTED: uncharacterized protein LOC109235000 [Nicotiana attenuata]
MGRGRQKRTATTSQVAGYAGTSTPVLRNESNTIRDLGETSMERWPPLSATKEGMKTPLDKVIHRGKVVSYGPMKHASPSVSKNVAIGASSVEKGQKQRANLFVRSNFAAKGMDLSFIAPTLKNGKVIVELCKEEIEEETLKWKQALILYVVGGIPTIGATERYIASVWKFIAKPKVYFHNDGYFMVRFNSIEDRDEVLYSGPHMPNNKPIIVKVWSADFDINKEVLQTIPVWFKISSGLGIPLYADACTTQVDRISYARVLVEMNVAKELPRSIKVTDPNGREFVQEIAYDWVPEFCNKCIQVGHKCRVDEQVGPKLKAKNPNQKQEWQPKPVLKVQEAADKEQPKMTAPSIEGNASTSTLVASASIGARKRDEEQARQTFIGKTTARSRERQSVDVVNVLNGFNLLTESELQLAMPRQMEEGTSRQQGNNGQEGTMQPLFIPHKIKERKAMQIIRKITPGWACLDNYEYSSRGRIWLLCDSSEIDCIELERSSQIIHNSVYVRRLDMRFTFTIVYGLHSVEDRRILWNEQTSLHSIQQGPWLIMGDYNTIRSGEDRPLGNLVQQMEIRDFNDLIESTGLTKMKTSGRRFTWTNGHTYSRFDRALINAEWMLAMPHLEVWVMDPHCSDHSSRSITLEEDEDHRPKPFKFLNHLAEHDEFVKIVSEAWERPQEQNIMRNVWHKLKRVKQAMKVLNNNEYNALGDRIKANNLSDIALKHR